MQHKDCRIDYIQRPGEGCNCANGVCVGRRSSYPRGLDDDIREIVHILIDAGFKTTDSGDGRLEGIKANMKALFLFRMSRPKQLQKR